VISKAHVRKLLHIKRLQKSLYGRLAADGTLALEAVRGFDVYLAQARQAKGVILSEPGFASENDEGEQL
jgi:hypothetical protein